MANIDCDAIITRVREVLQDGAGSIRTISSARFDGGFYQGMSPEEQSLRALATPRVEPSVFVTGRNPDSPPINGTLLFYDVTVTVAVVRHLSPTHKLDDAKRDDIKALAANDSDIVAQALCWPGNLTATSGGTPTGLIGGYLRFEGSDEPEVSLGDEAGRITSIHRFNGIVRVTPAVS